MEDFEEMKWYALHTKSRHEKLVFKTLRTKNIEAYMPIKKIKKKWSDRIKIVELPLFSGYLFVKISILNKSLVLNNKGVVKIIGKIGPEAIPEEQIQTLKCFENHDIQIDPYLNLKEGEPIRVKKGIFKGAEGIIVKKKNKYRLYLQLNVLSQTVSVEIDSCDVELQ